mgnify:CR=1 FL=1
MTKRTLHEAVTKIVDEAFAKNDGALDHELDEIAVESILLDGIELPVDRLKDSLMSEAA